MTIANGRTNCKNERDLVFQGFKEQLQILESSMIEQKNLFTARLDDIITDESLSNEEKLSQKVPWYNELQELEERHIRIKRSVFIGLYSFWETSLMNMVNAHIPSIVVIARNFKKSSSFGASDYLKLIYGEELPAFVNLIDNNIREFRNYMVHGTLTEKRESLIKVLVNSHQEFCVVCTCRDYTIRNYSGLFELLNLFVRELDSAENKTLEIKNLKTK